MKLIAWLVIAGLGVATSIWAYRSDHPAEGFSKISSGMIVAARTTTQRIDKPIPFPSIKAGIKQMPASGISAMLAASSGQSGEHGRSLRFQISEKLIELSFAEAGINQSNLAWGKLPRVGAHEVLAGAEVARRDQCQVAETIYKVTGGLAGAAGLLARSYVLPADELATEHDREDQADFRSAVLVPLETAQPSARQVRQQLAELFPQKEFDRMACAPMVGPRTFYLTLFGEGLLLLGGSGFFISLYTALARVPTGILREPLAALSNHRRLNWGVHLTYFGLYLLVAALVFRAPDLRNAIQAIISAGFNEEGNPLHYAGTAYLSRNILWAALVTFCVNFFLGSLLFLTLPSCVLPGSGSLLAGFRAVSWGLLLAPATIQQTYAMLPHSGTLLLEGEGYILAAFFGLMIPVAIFGHPAPEQPAPPQPPAAEPEPALPNVAQSDVAQSGPAPKRGYLWALLLNLKGSLLVAIVLAIAAIYEATEVIQMLKNSGRV
jgi:hypothetical protein